jgi:hypothetical protein
VALIIKRRIVDLCPPFPKTSLPWLFSIIFMVPVIIRHACGMQQAWAHLSLNGASELFYSTGGRFAGISGLRFFRDHSTPKTVFVTSPQMVLSGNSCGGPNILHLVQVFIKCVRLPPLVIQINAIYIYNSLQCDLRNCIYDLFHLHYPLRQFLWHRTFCTLRRYLSGLSACRHSSYK